MFYTKWLFHGYLHNKFCTSGKKHPSTQWTQNLFICSLEGQAPSSSHLIKGKVCRQCIIRTEMSNIFLQRTCVKNGTVTTQIYFLRIYKWLAKMCSIHITLKSLCELITVRPDFSFYSIILENLYQQFLCLPYTNKFLVRLDGYTC